MFKKQLECIFCVRGKKCDKPISDASPRCADNSVSDKTRVHSRRAHACHNADPKISRRLSRIVHIPFAIHEFVGEFVRTTGASRRKAPMALSAVSGGWKGKREGCDDCGRSRLVDGICRKGRKETGK